MVVSREGFCFCLWSLAGFGILDRGDVSVEVREECCVCRGGYRSVGSIERSIVERVLLDGGPAQCKV